MVEKYTQALKKLALSDEANLGDADTVLGIQLANRIIEVNA